jgi:chromosome segregation protein
MTAPRLIALRLHGFKSFAEPTVVEFGPGISAVVGPNGSGKSNLADALRWALGEQGRSLRIRKAEDVIFAGSERRAALGMADVTIVLDNADRLLPVDYTVVELGRRLYRSGENDYLLNRTRVRLRDLVDLLDAAHLADNAFLFIGQGMVDQALALRPEERRPLFEEVAGVRRHERRRRRAEEQLAEAEANLARVADLVAELRPHARRLAAQADKLAAQASVVRELVDALLLDAHRRWAEAVSRVRATAEARGEAEAALRRARDELRAVEDRTAARRAAVETLAAAVDERVAEHETARAALTALQLQEARRASEAEAFARERRQIAEAATAVARDLEAAEALLAEPSPEPDLDTAAALAATERALADARAELDILRRTRAAEDERRAALERAAAVRRAEAEAARRRRDDVRSRYGAAERVLEQLRERLAETRADLAAAIDRREATAVAVEAARAAEAEARRAAAAAEAAQATLEARRRELAGAAAGARARAAELEGLLAGPRAGPGIEGPMRRVLDELAVRPELRAAAASALGEVLGAVVVEADRLAELTSTTGSFLVRDWAASGSSGTASESVARFVRAVEAAGGGPLAEAVDDEAGDLARRLLAQAVWLPTVEAVLEVGPLLPTGWIAVSRDGRLCLDGPRLRIGDPDPSLERRALLSAATAEGERLGAELAQLDADVRRAAAEAESARAAHRSAEAALRQAETVQRAAEARRSELERAVARLEQEVGWQTASLDQLASALRSAEAAVAAFAEPAVAPSASAATEIAADVGSEPELEAEFRRREAALAELEARRAELAAAVARQEEARRAAEARRARAEATRELALARLADLARAEAELAAREADTRVAAGELSATLAEAEAAERAARAAVEEARAALAAEREALAAAEDEIAAHRQRLRAAEDRYRAAESAEMEARLALDACREQIVVELAALGEPAEAVLVARLEDGLSTAPGARPEPGGDASRAAGEGGSSRLEALVARLAETWATTPPPTGEGPSPIRIAQLRRRVAELGAVNPFAAEEYAEVRARLERLEAQEADLRAAIARTRRLIDELNDLVARQFTTTFDALAAAFERRFRQLFGGGQARLLLTEPGDLAGSGIDIVARPPGKKLQSLAMLSGGERALTAVALLFAMLEVRPVPFCVLDEVDAALDEANIGRFRAALRELAAGIQFVVITHNRGTIEEADALYGVTVGDDSVSRVISLRLEEARDLAARSRVTAGGGRS